MSGPVVTFNRAARVVSLTVNRAGVRGPPGDFADAPSDGFHYARAGAAWSRAMPSVSNDPQGFEDRAHSVITWDTGTRTFTIAPVGAEYAVWSNGKRIVKDAAAQVVWSDTHGPKVFYFDVNGDIQVADAFVDSVITQTCLIAYGYWEQAQQAWLLGGLFDERHGHQMDAAVHVYLHNTQGARYGGGLALTLGAVGGIGNDDLHHQFSTTSGLMYDEDLAHGVAAKALTDGIYTVYQTSTGVWSQQGPHDYPMVLDGVVPQFNDLAGGINGLSAISDNDYALAHICFAPLLGGGPQVFAILGQAQYANLFDARDAAVTERSALELGGLPMPEVIFGFSAVYRYQDSNTNASRCEWEDADYGAAEATFVDWRQAPAPGGGENPSTAQVAPPSTPTSPGAPGQWAWSDPYVYRCVALNTWRRWTVEDSW